MRAQEPHAGARGILVGARASQRQQVQILCGGDGVGLEWPGEPSPGGCTGFCRARGTHSACLQPGSNPSQQRCATCGHEPSMGAHCPCPGCVASRPMTAKRGAMFPEGAAAADQLQSSSWRHKVSPGQPGQPPAAAEGGGNAGAPAKRPPLPCSVDGCKNNAHRQCGATKHGQSVGPMCPHHCAMLGNRPLEDGGWTCSAKSHKDARAERAALGRAGGAGCAAAGPADDSGGRANAHSNVVFDLTNDSV